MDGFAILGESESRVTLHLPDGPATQSAGGPDRWYLLHSCGEIHEKNMGAAQSDSSSVSRQELVNRIKDRLSTVDPLKARALGGTFLFNIMKGQAVYSWTLDLNQIAVYEGEPEGDPDCTFTLTEHNFKQLVTGREDPRAIMQAGRCSVTGDIMRAMQLEPYIKLQ